MLDTFSCNQKNESMLSSSVDSPLSYVSVNRFFFFNVVLVTLSYSHSKTTENDLVGATRG